MEIAVEGLACGYGKDRPLQRNLNFIWKSGTVCCVLGPNGCGKTLLLKTILGLVEAIEGHVLIDGSNARTWSASRRARVLAYVSQAHRPPFPYRVEDIVMLGRLGQKGHFRQPSRQDKEIVEDAMNSLGILGFRDQIYSDLSGGELQLVMIARALAQQPQFLILDEPTASLDYGNAVRVITKVHELAEKGYGVVMTTHSPDHAFLMSARVLLLQKGAPMTFGKAEDVVTERAMRTAYGVDVRIVEFADPSGEIVRMCAPVIAHPKAK